jgi:hypothetical protein
MPAPRTLSEIKSKLLSPALTSLYEVQIGFPPGLTVAYLKSNIGASLDQDRLNLMCSEATLPGSNLATLDLTNDRPGVTERHAYRRIYDDRIDLTFYVDAENYLPIRVFETWMKYIAQESIAPHPVKGKSGTKNYFYSFQYPDQYMSEDGLTVTKFEKSSLGYEGSSTTKKVTKGGQLKYTFIRSFPVSINSMPVSYDSSSLLKCTVSMSYIRYVVDKSNPPLEEGTSPAPATTVGSPDSPFNVTPQQLAIINSQTSQVFNSNLNFGITPLTTGGVSFDASQASGNAIEIDFAAAGNLNFF